MGPSDTSSRRPLNVLDYRSPAKSSRPIITRDIERPSSPLSRAGGAQLEKTYIVPASSSSRNHQRHSSANDRLPIKEREREKLYPASHLLTAHPPHRSSKDSRDDSYEYSQTRSHVSGDLAPPKPRIRQGSRSGARPVSMIDFDRNDKVYTHVERTAPPPVSTRAIEGVGRKESLRQSNHALDDDLSYRESSRKYPREERPEPRYRDVSKSHAPSRDDYIAYTEDTKRERPRRPTMENDAPQKYRGTTEKRGDEDGDRHHRHHHLYPEHGYASDNDHKRRHTRKEYDDIQEPSRRKDLDPLIERERRRDHDERYEERRRDFEGKDEKESRRHRYERPERERPKDHDDLNFRHPDEAFERDRWDKNEAPSQVGGLAAGGAAAAAGVAGDSIRKIRHKDDDEYPRKEAYGRHSGPDHDSPAERAASQLDVEERRLRRRQERERQEYERESKPEPLRIEAPPGSDSTQKSHELYPQSGERGQYRRRRRYHRRSPSRDTPPTSGKDESSDSDVSSDHIHRQLKVVSPPPAITAEPPLAKSAPKGILKQPREKFPEDANTLREGVAPLDAAKKGIPPEARWTRINRRLVNPEALEQEGVRFEEYPDYIIVLKVLSAEEISKFTQRTHEIRERRRLEQGSQGSGSGNGTDAASQDDKLLLA